MLAAVAIDRDFQTFRERVSDRDAHAVQSARDHVRGFVALLVELAARMQHREGHLDHVLAFLRMQPYRNAAPFVGHFHRSVAVDGHGDAPPEAGQRFVDRVVDRLLNNVQGMHDMRVHPRVLAHRLETLERLERRFVVDNFSIGHRCFELLRAADVSRLAGQVIPYLLV